MVDNISYIFLAAWFVSLLRIGWSKNYKSALLLNIFSASCMVVYFLFVQTYVAAAVTSLAVCNSFAQYLMPDAGHARVKYARNVIAVICSAIVSVILYQEPSDLFMCLGFTCVRLGESQGSVLWVRLGFVFGMISYSVFGVMQELYLMTFLQVIVIVAFLYKSFVPRADQSRDK